eukprot:11720588-Prorocentrum_lima.AAC.1
MFLRNWWQLLSGRKCFNGLQDLTHTNPGCRFKDLHEQSQVVAVEWTQDVIHEERVSPRLQ